MAQRKCKHCKKLFEKTRPLQYVCSPNCGIEYTQAQKCKKAELAKQHAKRQEKTRMAQMKHALETVPELTRKAQTVFNAYIRARDKGKPCISCGAPYREAFGGAFDAGHYRSTGSAAHLRFDEMNCHGQCVKCNRHLSGNAVAYRVGLIARVGLAEVERLEQNNTPKKWDKDELRELIAVYRQKIKELAQ